MVRSSAQRRDVKLRAAGWRPASSGAPLAAHPIMPVQAARRRANSTRGSRLGRREKRRRTVNFNDELAATLRRRRRTAEKTCYRKVFIDLRPMKVFAIAQYFVIRALFARSLKETRVPC